MVGATLYITTESSIRLQLSNKSLVCFLLGIIFAQLGVIWTAYAGENILYGSERILFS